MFIASYVYIFLFPLCFDVQYMGDPDLRDLYTGKGLLRSLCLNFVVSEEKVANKCLCKARLILLALCNN